MKNLKKVIISSMLGVLICLSTLCISPVVTVNGADAVASYTTYIDVPTLNSGLKIEPSVIFNVSSQDDLTEITNASVKPTVVLLTVDEEMDVVLGDTTRTFKSVFETYLKGKSIPAVRIETDKVAKAFVEYMKEAYYIADITVVSKSDEILGTIYDDDTTYIANGVLDVSEQKLSANRYDFWENIAKANKVGANILMINGEDENAGVAANYAAALGKVCWGAVPDNEAKTVGAVAAGCYGLVGSDIATMQGAIEKFAERGFGMSQQIAAHRGITKYANENSLTSCAAAANEGATHIEVDVQVTRDGEILLCHNSGLSTTSNASGNTWFVNMDSDAVRDYRLTDYDSDYRETFATLDELIEVMLDTDVIFIVELKLDGASDYALRCNPIQKVYETFSSYEEMKGRWLAITFYGSYAKLMREVCPEIPVCCLGYADETGKSTHNWGEPPTGGVGNYKNYIKFNRGLNVGLDYVASAATYSSVKNYLARGYLQNTWTYEDTSHVSYGVNIATTNKAEEMAMQVKKVGVGTIELTESELTAGQVKIACETYNGFVKECTCAVTYVDGTIEAGKTVNAVFYYKDKNYGIYSNMLQVKVK